MPCSGIGKGSGAPGCSQASVHFVRNWRAGLPVITRVRTKSRDDAAFQLAEGITANSEFGVYMTKLGLWANLDAPSLRHAIQLENRTQVLGTFTGNMREAAQAFVEKRSPVWKQM